MKFAYFGFPHLGGTHTVFASLRSGLATHGIRLDWLGVGPKARAAFDDPAWAAHRECGTVVALDGAEDRRVAEEAAAVLRRDAFDGVLVNVLASSLQTNLVRFLPTEIRRIMLVHNITPGTYAAAGAIRDWVHMTIGVSPRIADDLVKGHGFPEDRTTAIANAIDLSRFADIPSRRDGPLRILSVGRLDEGAKGVLWLPEIMRRLADLDVRLTIAGDGPARARLAEACRPMGGRIDMLGPVAPTAVPALLASHHLFILPSRYEGLPQSPIEAMAAGCVPVASRIRGVTDAIVDHGRDGLLFPVGDTPAAAAAIRSLTTDREKLALMSDAGRASVQGRFDLATQAAAYAAVIERVMADPPTIAAPLPFDRWSYPRGLRPGLRTYLPEPIKNLLRTWKERSAA